MALMVVVLVVLVVLVVHSFHSFLLTEIILSSFLFLDAKALRASRDPRL